MVTLKNPPIIPSILLVMATGFPVWSSSLEYRQQGLDYRAQERWPEAIAALQRAVDLAPEDVKGYIILGWTQHLAKQRSAASLTLWQALWRNPFTVEACNALGIVYLVEGSLPPAVLIHNWAAILRSGNEIAHYNLSLAYQRQGLEDWAIVHGQRATELEPNNPHPFVALAVIYWTQGEQNRAIAMYQAALSLDDRYKDAVFLDHLQDAGFSHEQVEITRLVRLKI